MLSDFEPMANHIPAGEKGVAKIEHFTVSEQDAKYTSIRAAFNPGRDEYVAPGKYVRLYIGRTLMMSDTRMEQSSNRAVIHHSKGDVLIAGLGVGLILLPILRKPEVKSVTVIEKYQDVVDLVDPAVRSALKPKLASKLKVITADILEWSPPKGQKWDCIYFDIWPNVCEDNLGEMAKLHRKFARRKRSTDVWMDSWKRGYLQDLRSRSRGYY